LDLPPELRNLIYAHVVNNSKGKGNLERYNPGANSLFRYLPPTTRNLLLTCKTVWFELLPALFASHIWVAGLRPQDYGYIDILPHGNWLLTPHTFPQRTSTIKHHVEFRLEHIFQNFKPKQDAEFTIDIEVLKAVPYFSVEFADTVWVMRNYHRHRRSYRLDRIGIRSIFPDYTMGRAIEGAHVQINGTKAVAGEKVTNATVGKWYALPKCLDLAYELWVRERFASKVRPSGSAKNLEDWIRAETSTVRRSIDQAA
jgi:hypothetical protein